MIDTAAFARSFDRVIDDALFWVSDNAAFLFDGLRLLFEGFYGAVYWALGALPWYVLAVLLGLVGWRLIDARAGIGIAIGMAACAMMGLWSGTMSTFALVLSATVLALLVALPVGVLAGLKPRLNRVIEPVLDLIQTMPPYIYLLPAIALLGFGPGTALAATLIVAMPPAIRLTALGIGRTPTEFLELGKSLGMTRSQMFLKIRLPFAVPSIMAGINQTLMMAFGMVVIAGIVGSGGLGQAIYDAIRTLDIAKSIDAAIAIVILTIVIDRLTQSLAQKKEGSA